MSSKNAYRLLDSGDGLKLESLGGITVVRQSQVSLYPKTNPSLWKNPDAIYHRSDKGGGEWEFRNKSIPKTWNIEYSKFTFQVKLTPFGHIGLFPEQKENWEEIIRLGKKFPNANVLNLFAYSGGSTLASLQAGFSVCHVDASKGMVEWARQNCSFNHLDEKPVRWIVDDVMKFVEREKKRGKKYQGFILDPPTYGRGSNGEIWKIEEELPKLLDVLIELADGKPDFIFLSGHSNGFTPMVYRRMLQERITNSKPEQFQTKELATLEESGKELPAGGSCVYFRE